MKIRLCRYPSRRAWITALALLTLMVIVISQHNSSSYLVSLLNDQNDDATETAAAATNTSLPSKTIVVEDEAISHSSIIRKAPDFYSRLVEQARQFVSDRKGAYVQAGKESHWKLRGIGYLYTRHNIILAGRVEGAPFRTGPNRITIWNVANSTTAVTPYQCELLTIYVRVNGPEIFAGSATAVQQASGEPGTPDTCHWEFFFDVRVPGDFEIDAKVLLWNGKAQVRMQPRGGNFQCNYTNAPRGNKPVHIPGTTLARYPVHGGFIGFKLYDSIGSCCEICTRLAPHCRYWSTPPLELLYPERKYNGCELYFEKDAPPNELLPPSQLLQKEGSQPKRAMRNPHVRAYGPPHTNPTAYFVGCGWSYWFTLDFPCLSGEYDDQVFFLQRKVRVAAGATSTTSSSGGLDADDSSHGRLNASAIAETARRSSSSSSSHQDLPLCQKDNLRNSQGRWIREPWPEDQQCPKPMVVNEAFRKKTDIMDHNLPNQPHCWHRDDLTRASSRCEEFHCKLVPKQSSWYSSVRRETRWYGVWRNYDCNYLEYSDDELQKCINQRKIASITTTGCSIAQFMEQYVGVRFQNIQFFDATAAAATSNNATSSGGDAIHVVLDTLATAHLTWQHDHSQWVQHLQDLPDVPRSREERYFVSGYYLSSERETYCHVDRIEELNRLIVDMLEPKGYRLINVFDLSKAFTYDSVAQADGLHIVGPPMKMAITKAIHYMCKDTDAQGTIV